MDDFWLHEDPLMTLHQDANTPIWKRIGCSCWLVKFCISCPTSALQLNPTQSCLSEKSSEPLSQELESYAHWQVLGHTQDPIQWSKSRPRSRDFP